MILAAAQGKFADLQAALGHRFSDLALLEEALTHASAATPARASNERLEFLGDRVLGLAIAEALIERHPGEAEGKLAPRLNALVRREALAETARAIGLGEHLRLAKSEAMTGGRRKEALLADAMEAVIAAVYLDGGLDAVRSLIRRLWAGLLEGQGEAPVDAKTALQEWAQARGLAPPVYQETARSGPDHAPVFTITARLETGEKATATAASKRAAQQEAAARILARLERGA